jgi:benzoylformate decarboxylase
VLVTGAPVFTYFPNVPGPTVCPGTEVVELTDDPLQASRALVGTSVVGDVALAVRQLLDLVTARSGGAPPRMAPPTVGPASAPLAPDFVFSELAKALPAHAILCVEAPSWERFLVDHVRQHDPGSYYASASGSLGYALPASIGVALARPARPVVAIVGDGSAQYAVQGLWTAARHRVPVTVVILDNHEYAILKSVERLLHRRRVPGLDLPGVDFEGLARGYGLPYRAVSAPEALGPAFAAAFASGEANMIKIEVDPFVPKPL